MTRLLRVGDRLVVLRGHGVEPRAQLGEARLEIVNDRVIILYGQQRCDIWVHEPSEEN